MSGNFQATAGELTLVSRILTQGDPKKSGVLPGDVAVRIFSGAQLPPTALGEIWAIADEENHGSLRSKGVAIAVRLMGWAQNGEKVTSALVNKPGPLPTIEGISDIAAQNTGMSIPRSPPLTGGLPPLTTQDKTKFHNMFNKSGPVKGLLNGDQARNVFLKSKLSHDKLAQIWTLADTHDRGSLDATDFTLAMYFIQGIMSGQIGNLPPTLPPGLYQQASGVPGPSSSVISHNTGNDGSYSPAGSTFSHNRIHPQYTGQSQLMQPNLTGSLNSRRGPAAPPNLPARPAASQVGSSAFGAPAFAPWDISDAEKAESDGFFDTLDTQRHGFIEGDVAVPFMLESHLPGEELAQVWDLADINNDGRLTKDGFAVALHLIKKRLAGVDIPSSLPASLIPPSMRKTKSPASSFAQHPAPAVSDSLADLIWDDPPAAAPPLAPQQTGLSPHQTGGFRPPAPALPARSVASPPPRPAPAHDPFGSSPFGSNAAQDLMGDDEHTSASPPMEDKSAEIGNAQNQLNSTSHSLQNTTAERQTAENTLADQASQLATLQTQLSSAKAAYETETKLLSALRDRLTAQTAEMQKTREAIISAESDLSAVRVEKAEVEGSLLRDKEEVRDLHRRMLEFGKQAESIKTETEKLKKEAKQQRGLLAIARKQLSTKETEKAKAEKEMQEAGADLSSAMQEKDEVDAAIAQLAQSTSTPERTLTSESLSFAASQPLPGTPQPLPGTPDPSSPGSKSNNPFERLAISSGSSTPIRTGSPFLPFASTNIPSPSNPGVDVSSDPFGFDQAFASDATEAPKPSEVPEVAVTVVPESIGSSSAAIDASSPTSPDGTETFTTPPSTSSVLPESQTVPPRSTTLDTASAKFPAIDEVARTDSPARHLPGHLPFEGTDLNANLKEIEVDESDSDIEDETPLALLSASKENGSAPSGASPSPATDSAPPSSFDDMFGGSQTNAGPARLPTLDSTSSLQSSSSPFGSVGALRSLADPNREPSVAGVNAFDEAMGIIAPGTTTAKQPSFSFDDAFDDNFDFGTSIAMSEPTSPPASKANGTTLPLAKSDGFDALFTVPSSNNGDRVAPMIDAQEAPDAFPPNTPAAAPPTGLSFDNVFSGLDSAPASDLSASLTSAPPARASEALSEHVTPSTSAPFPTSATSPPKSISSTHSRPVSPPPRMSSPTPRPRASTSSSEKGDKVKEPARHSKLSLRLPFGKKKKQQEAAVPPPSQFLTPPAEEPRAGTPASEDDVDSVKQITAMGFSRSQAVEALEQYGYDVPRALNSLLGST